MIIGISGKKQSGKTTLADFINDRYFYAYRTKLFSFADPLKNLCIQLLGLTHAQCYGTDEQKNSLTHLKWENLPTCIPAEKMSQILHPCEKIGDCVETIANHIGVPLCRTGYMTAREVLQYIGTDVFRKIYSDVWVRATINEVSRDAERMSVIIDCRFPNEISGIKDAGGYIIRLSRDPHNDGHYSEVALDQYNGFDFTIDNRDISLEEKNSIAKRYIDSLLYNKYKHLPSQ